jgi:hypothetical protein
LRPADRTLRDELQRVRRRWFRTVALSAGWRIAVAAAVALCALAAVDRLFHVSGGRLLAVSAAAVLLIAASAVVIAWPYRRRPGDRRVARFVEEQCPEFDGAIVSAVDVAGRPDATPFAAIVVERAAARLAALDPAQVVGADVVRSGVGRAAAAAVALGLALAIAAPSIERAAAEARVRLLPSTFTIRVLPGNVRVPAGAPITIAARLETRGGPLGGLAPELQLESGGRMRTVPMTPVADGYEVRINEVDRAFDYRVRAGRAVSDRYGVTALFPPHVTAIDLHYEYPAFTALRPRDESDGGDIYAPAGTRVRMRVRADKPVASAEVALGSDRAGLPVTRIDDRTFESTLMLARDGSYRATVADADGLRGDSVEYFIRLVADRPAEIHIVRPAGDQEITPLEEVTIEARADDDYGIASMDMVFAVAGGQEHVVPFQSVSGPETARVGARLIAAEELGVKPGDVISYYARARDVPHAKASTLSHSEIYFLEVKPFSEEYSLADSQAMAAATGTELAGLIAAQKEVISATWNLQRRAAAGSSAADVHAVAAAQAEVKARTERAAASARPPRRGIRMFFQFGQEPPGRTSGSSVAAAAAAMGRALEHLNAGATKDAMSPEMAALNALLKAESEIRQRQITQQRNGASSYGSGRQGQDLSNLFDRELKRQQRTNYETGSQVEQPSAKPEEQNALDRIRDLARRQEQLAKEQQALGAKSEDERQRELQRLRREQEELRRQLEDASRRQEQNASASGASGKQGGANGAQSEIRSALDEMRRAASDLQRNDSGSAAARAAKAAEQLRNAEARLQAQAEAGQQGSGASGEARRLADTLDALREQRDRLTRLQRRLAELEKQAGGQQGQQSADQQGSRGEQSGRAGAPGTKAGTESGRGSQGSELQRAREEYAREVQRGSELMRQLSQRGRDTGGAAATPEGQEWSWGAPGTEAWKQDFGKWEALGKDVGRALERSESAVGERLSKSLAHDRLRAGASERVPDEYADRVARYYESLARAGGRR